MSALGCTRCLHKAASYDSELCNLPGLSGVGAESQIEFLRIS